MHAPALPALLRRLRPFAPLRRALAMLGVARQRRALARLDARLLDDAGISAGRARAEAARPIWDVPRHWRL